MHGDKEIAATLRPLLAIATAVVATQSTSPRALPAEELAARCRRAGAVAVQASSSVEEAIRSARTRAGAGSIVAVTGSLAVVGEARTALGLGVAENLWADEPRPQDRRRPRR